MSLFVYCAYGEARTIFLVYFRILGFRLTLSRQASALW